MIQIRFKITLPLMVLVLIGLFIWLVRDPDRNRPHRPPKSAPRRRRPSRPVSARSRRPHPRTIIFTGTDDDREPEHPITYEEALLSGTYSPDDLTAIGNREAMAAGQAVYDQAQQTHVTMPKPNWRKS